MHTYIHTYIIYIHIYIHVYINMNQKKKGKKREKGMNFFFFFCVMLISIYSVAKSYILFSHLSFSENNQLQGKVTSNNVHYIFNIVNFTQQHDSILSYRGYISAQPYIFYILLLSQEVCKDPLPCCIFPPQQLWSSSKVYASWAVLQQFVLSKLPPNERVLEAKWQ